MDMDRDVNLIRNEIFQYMEQLNLSYQVLEHAPLFTCEDAKKHRPHIRGGACKNIFTRNKKGDTHYLIVADADYRIDLKALKKNIGATALSFASEVRLFRYLKTIPGSVSPLGLIFDERREVKVIIDENLMEKEYLNFHPNDNTATIEIRRDDFKTYLDSLGHDYALKKL